MEDIFVIIFLLIALSITGCRHISNEKNASIVYDNNKIFLKLIGKRKPLVHDPLSIIQDGLVDDSLLLEIPKLQDGIISGDKIIVPDGNYKYQGAILIDKDVLKIDLQIINTDDKLITPESYNGVYSLKR